MKTEGLEKAPSARIHTSATSAKPRAPKEHLVVLFSYVGTRLEHFRQLAKDQNYDQISNDICEDAKALKVPTTKKKNMTWRCDQGVLRWTDESKIPGALELLGVFRRRLCKEKTDAREISLVRWMTLDEDAALPRPPVASKFWATATDGSPIGERQQTTSNVSKKHPPLSIRHDSPTDTISKAQDEHAATSIALVLALEAANKRTYAAERSAAKLLRKKGKQSLKDAALLEVANQRVNAAERSTAKLLRKQEKQKAINAALTLSLEAARGRADGAEWSVSELLYEQGQHVAMESEALVRALETTKARANAAESCLYDLLDEQDDYEMPSTIEDLVHEGAKRAHQHDDDDDHNNENEEAVSAPKRRRMNDDAELPCELRNKTRASESCPPSASTIFGSNIARDPTEKHVRGVLDELKKGLSILTALSKQGHGDAAS